METLIDIKTACELINREEGFPSPGISYGTLVWQARRGGFLEKTESGLLINKHKMREYFQIRKKPTLSKAMSQAGRGSAAIYYTMNKLGIKAKEKYGHKYLEETDVKRILEYYNGRNQEPSEKIQQIN